MSFIDRAWRDMVLGFLLGCLFWQYKYDAYCHVYDWYKDSRLRRWWEGKG